MNRADSFLKSLKEIGFPQINAYKSADFEPLFLDDELKPILESICDLNADNVLTSEELSEYAALSPSEIAYLEKLAEDETFITSEESKNMKRHEAEYLEEYLALVAEEKNSLQKQQELLKSHEGLLLEEKERCETQLIDTKKQFESFMVQIVPQTEKELTSNLMSVINITAELQALITDSDGDSKILPSSIFKDLDSYFNNEKRILKHVKKFLQKQLEVHDDDDLFSKVSACSQSKLLREVNFLKNILKSCKIEEFSAISEKVKIEAVIQFFKRYEDECFPKIFKIPTSQLRNKLTEETKLNEQLKEKQKILELRLSNAISELVNAQCSEIGIAYSEEVIQCYNNNFEKIQEPLEHLLSQRARLEFIVLYLNAYKRCFETVKYLVESTSSFIKKEKTILWNMKELSEENKLEQKPKTQDDYLSDCSILLTIYNILNGIEDQEPSFLSHEEIFKQIKKLFEDQEHLEKLQEEKLHHLHLMEEQSAGLEKYVHEGKQFTKLLEANKNFNILLNKLDIKMSLLCKTVSETEADMNEKEKILERKEYLQLARRLYIDACLDPVRYREHIKKIKDIYENVLDSSLNQTNM